ncbi:MAG: tRNA nucleotidyltransferase, partial [Paludibacteraceae bacterium]|nr:tRNA nucleotidyltransferase [Paludibacteraceae bacterium]
MKYRLNHPIFQKISDCADKLNLPCFVIGGFVRDLILKRESNDIDVVVLGSGIEMATELKNTLGKGAYLSVFKNFGTAQVKY